MDWDALIEQLAAQPKKARGEMGEVEMQSLKDLIDAAKHGQQSGAANTASRGLRITQLLPPGAV